MVIYQMSINDKEIKGIHVWGKIVDGKMEELFPQIKRFLEKGMLKVDRTYKIVFLIAEEECPHFKEGD